VLSVIVVGYSAKFAQLFMELFIPSFPGYFVPVGSFLFSLLAEKTKFNQY
jgi:hypothetical protein